MAYKVAQMTVSVTFVYPEEYALDDATTIVGMSILEDLPPVMAIQLTETPVELSQVDVEAMAMDPNSVLHI
jgi:hypothetical protein